MFSGRVLCYGHVCGSMRVRVCAWARAGLIREVRGVEVFPEVLAVLRRALLLAGTRLAAWVPRDCNHDSITLSCRVL